MNALGQTFLIANPTSQNGNGLHAGMYVKDALSAVLGENNFSVQFTQSAGHAVQLAEKLKDNTNTVIALGGDGVIHEVANGLMKRSIDKRPNFAIIPVGSGNDYARSLNISTKLDKAVQQILFNKQKRVDVGLVNDTYFLETLSFGLDAAIALETMDSRKKKEETSKLLYVKAGYDQILNNFKFHDFNFTATDVIPYDEKHKLSFESGQNVTGKSVVFAIQIGATYGGGFKICPKAKIDDGYFDLCFAKPPINVPRAAIIFAMAKGGKHTGIKNFNFAKFKKMTLEFEHDLPAQADGEKLLGKKFEIEMLPSQINAIVG